MNVSRWAIDRPLPAALIFVGLCIAGLLGFNAIPVAKFPDIQFPTITVTVNLPGATPSQLESDVTRRVEDSVSSIANIRQIISRVNEGSSTTSIVFELGHDLDQAVDEVRDAVTRTRADMPVEIEEPIISRLTVVGGAMLTYAVQSDALAQDELSWFIDDTVKKTVFGIRGIGSFVRTGGVEREVRVDLDPRALQAYGVPANTVSQQLARLQLERPGGRATQGGQEQSIRTLGTVGTAADLADYPISLPDGRTVRLSAIAAVRDGNADPRQAALLDGETAIGFQVFRSRGVDELEAGREVRAQIARLAAEHPRVKFIEVASSLEDTEASYESSMIMLLEGGVLAVIVVFIFLRDWRATWISAAALPLSIIPTFAVIHWLGFSLNFIVLLALAVVVGLLVDDAIVEVENIVRHRRMGKSAIEAARDAADEIGVAVIATSVTLAAVFVPVAFMPGVPGQFFREFGWTAAIAVMFSLLVARMLTPMMAAYLMKGDDKPHTEPRWIGWYLGWVDKAIRHKRITLGIATVLFVLSLGLASLLSPNFLPEEDLGRTVVSLELPPGTPLQETVRATEMARQRLASIPELSNVFTTVGGAGAGEHGGDKSPEVRRASVTLRWSPANERERSQQELEVVVRERLANLPGMRVSFVSGGPGGSLALKLAGNNPQALVDAARMVERGMKSIPGLGNVTSSAALLRPEIVVVPNPARAADLGVSTTDIADAARVATSGDYRQRLAKLNLPERQIPIRVQLKPEALNDPTMLRELRVPATGGSVPLGVVADVLLSSGPAQIDRFQRERNIELNAELNGMPLGDAMQAVNALPVMQALPAGVRVIPTGDSEVFIDLFTGFAIAMGIGLLCVYAVLLLLLNSATQPITILSAVPLSAGGAFGGLLLMGLDLSMPALIGLISLIGIATKNSILLIDYAVMAQRDHGLNLHDALIDACRKRARPVIMTTVAMTAGMMPIALGLGADAAFRRPLAISIIGGLASSTLLSLVVVPAAYAAMDSVTARVRRLLGRDKLAESGVLVEQQ
ncbi:MAG TPA: efflux RND transporter permease subunit [Steroidobacteraceae bacterium]|nr:efflux RND transporter permease subunit [Steroidobacteraceae bacterium]